MKKLGLLLALVAFTLFSFGQGNGTFKNLKVKQTSLLQETAIGGTSVDGSSLLDMTSTTKGVLIPRMTSAQRDNIASPVEGLLIYNLTTNVFNFYDGGAWTTIGGAVDLAATLGIGNTTGANSISITDGQSILFNSGSGGSLVSASTGASRTWTMPDATGTIALTTDIPSPDGNGIYTSSSTVGAGRVVTLTDNINFNSGLFGIGITPTAKFQVKGNGTTTGVLCLFEDNAGTDRLKLFDDGKFILVTGGNASFDVTSAPVFRQSSPSVHQFEIYNSSDEIKFRLTNTGLFQFTTGGNASFDVTAASVFRQSSAGIHTFEMYNSSGAIRFRLNSSGLFQFTTGGNASFDVTAASIFTQSSAGVTPFQIKLSTSATAFFMNTAGDVGVGNNTTISAKFHIKGTNDLSGTLAFLTENSSGTDLFVINNAGGVGIGSTPDASAKLEVSSTTQGILFPRMTSTQGSAISSPADGLVIYVTDTNGTFTSIGFWGREAGVWIKF